MVTNSVGNADVNVFMGLGELPEYALVLLNRYNLTVQVEYYCTESEDENRYR